MISIVPAAIQSLTPAFLHPFLQHWGRIPYQQHPLFCSLFLSSEKLYCFHFYNERKLIGYVIVTSKKRILAEAFHGPVVLHRDHYTHCVNLLKEELRSKGIGVMRIFPPQYGTTIPGTLSHFQWASAVIDLRRDAEKIFASFNTNHRYGIRKALAAGIKVEKLNGTDVPEYIEASVSVFQRRGFYQNASRRAELRKKLGCVNVIAPSCGFVLGIRSPDTNLLIAGGIFIRSGDTMIYENGFSLREKKLSLSHTLLWHAMQLAKEQGCLHFDLLGYSLKHDKQLNDINNFKRWFGADILIYPQTSVVNLIPGGYQLLRLLGVRL